MEPLARIRPWGPAWGLCGSGSAQVDHGGCGLERDAVGTGCPPAERSATLPTHGRGHLGPGCQPAASPGSLECPACLARCPVGFGQSCPAWGRARGLSESPPPPAPSPRTRSAHTKPGRWDRKAGLLDQQTRTHQPRQSWSPQPAPRAQAGWPLMNHSTSKRRSTPQRCQRQGGAGCGA